jgi:Uma2 family endonuclease
MSTITTIPRPSCEPVETTTVPGKERGVMPGSWNLYDRLTDAIRERSSIRVAFDGRDIEIMTLGPKHEDIKELLGLFISEVYFGLEIDCRGLGSTTWKRSEVQRGIEADLSFYFDPSKLQASAAAASRESNDVADYPNPDLVVEIDISSPEIDRPGIYRAMQVPEVWRLRDGSISIEQLGPDGAYAAAMTSRFLHVRPDEVTQWLIEGKSAKRRDWRRRLQEWIQAELKPRVGG